MGGGECISFSLGRVGTKEGRTDLRAAKVSGTHVRCVAVYVQRVSYIGEGSLGECLHGAA